MKFIARLLPLSVKGWLLRWWMYRQVPKDSINYKFRMARKDFALSVEDAATLTGTTTEEVNVFELGLAGIFYESDVWSLEKLKAERKNGL